MGCWNGTCGLTGLPIIHGDEMFVFPIVESYRDSFCYSTALYRPSVMPFRAKYDDYGGGEECSGVGLELLIEGIRENLVELEVGENTYHDIAVKREGFTVEKFFEACHEKRLQFSNPMRGYENEPQTKGVFFTMVRKDVVDRLWSDWAFDMWKGSDGPIPEGFESDKYYVKNVTYEKLANLIPEFMAQRFENFQKATEPFRKIFEWDDKSKNLGEAMIYREMLEVFRSPSSERGHILGGMFNHMFGGGYADGGFSNFGDLQVRILLEYMNGDKETAYALMRECLVGYMVNSFMQDTRKVWMPPMHQGSQSDCYKEYLLLNNISNEIIQKEQKRWNEE